METDLTPRLTPAATPESATPASATSFPRPAPAVTPVPISALGDADAVRAQLPRALAALVDDPAVRVVALPLNGQPMLVTDARQTPILVCWAGIDGADALGTALAARAAVLAGWHWVMALAAASATGSESGDDHTLARPENLSLVLLTPTVDPAARMLAREVSWLRLGTLRAMAVGATADGVPDPAPSLWIDPVDANGDGAVSDADGTGLSPVSSEAEVGVGVRSRDIPRFRSGRTELTAAEEAFFETL